jgi:hypothetical protein
MLIDSPEKDSLALDLVACEGNQTIQGLSKILRLTTAIGPLEEVIQ